MGLNEFNKGEFYEALRHWENIWKDGSEEERSNIRGMIQLSAGLIKYNQKQFTASSYLLKKSIINISAAKYIHSEIDISKVINKINQIVKNKSSDDIACLTIYKK